MQKLDEMRRHEYPAGFPVRLALKDLELVREVEQSSGASMPLLDTVLARILQQQFDVSVGGTVRGVVPVEGAAGDRVCGFAV
jgi:3-hydroxyisobutyrate dehydrogenase-like beta-hydroxyacid dehydrogenase